MPSTSAVRASASAPPHPGAAAAPDDDALDYRRLFLATPTPILAVEHDRLHVVAANPAATRLLGQSEATLCASALPDLLSRAQRDALVSGPDGRPVPGALQARSGWMLERPDGRPVRLEVAAGPPVRFHGHLCAVLFQPAPAEPGPREVRLDGVDLTEFSFSALHDLKEPLHLVHGYLALLRDAPGAHLDAEARDFLDNAYAGTQRMQALVLGLLEYFRADAKGIAPEPLELAELADEAIAGLRLQAEEAQASITRDELPRVVADRIQLGRVMQNLLSNAIKFRGDRPPRIHLAAERDGPGWRVSVHDDGIGIAEADLERVLRPFQRTHSVDRYPGTGLGLSISRKIVERHGGRLWLASSPGRGTTVHFTLPDREAA